VARLQKRNLSKPTEVRPVGRGQLELIELADLAVARMHYEPGWRWSQDVKPLVGGDSCQVRHVGVVVSGRLYTEMDDGATMEIGPGDVYEIPAGHDSWVVGDEPWISIDIEGRRFFANTRDATDSRLLATILFTDLVSSTEMLARVGDAAWRGRLADYHSVARRTIERFRGREVATTGDGVLAVFDSPAHAVRAALTLNADAVALGLVQRAGVHTGRDRVYGRGGARHRGPPRGTGRGRGGCGRGACLRHDPPAAQWIRAGHRQPRPTRTQGLRGARRAIRGNRGRGLVSDQGRSLSSIGAAVIGSGFIG
jgi:hypothetical protein